VASLCQWLSAGTDYTDGEYRGESVTTLAYGPRSGGVIARTITHTYNPLRRLAAANYLSTSNLRFALTAGSTGESYEYTYDAGDRSGRTATASSPAAPTAPTPTSTTPPTAKSLWFFA